MDANFVGEMLRAAADDRRNALTLTGQRRADVACILEAVARDGLPAHRDLEEALDAIEMAYMRTLNIDE